MVIRWPPARQMRGKIKVNSATGSRQGIARIRIAAGNRVEARIEGMRIEGMRIGGMRIGGMPTAADASKGALAIVAGEVVEGVIVSGTAVYRQDLVARDLGPSATPRAAEAAPGPAVPAAPRAWAPVAVADAADNRLRNRANLPEGRGTQGCGR